MMAQNDNEQDQSRLKKLRWIAALQCYIEGDSRCSQQDENHGIFELAEESFNNGLLSLCLQAVLPYLGQYLLSMGGGQPRSWFRFQFTAYILRGSIIRFHSEIVSSFLLQTVYY